MASDKQLVGRIKDILSQALDIPAGEAREEFLVQACGNDVSLRKEVETLIEACEATDDFLSHDATGGTLMHIPDLIGTMIDNYRLIECIGEGGFGVIYRAEQTKPLHREVALKIIKLGMDTKNVLARFEAERQALARMNHPGIAQVYDAGATESGRPYFVMELVSGVPIIEYCDRHRLPMPQRIELFRQVCDAVQHAHAKGILHRDLKPSNILVGEENGKPMPKIIDFGVAKSLEGRLTEQTLATLQEMLIGTPMYMSPEQLNQDRSGIDTRSDIYSLGIILYELLAGTTPLDHKTPTLLTIAGMRRTLDETELPRPSRRFHAMGRETTTIASDRQIKPPTLERLLRGDLDWIIMKAIEKEREHRYDDVLALSEDLECYLGNRPVSAKSPDMVRRARKFIRRHSMASAVMVSIGITVLLGVGIMTFSFIRITRIPQGISEVTTEVSLPEWSPKKILHPSRGASVAFVDFTAAEGYVNGPLTDHPMWLKDSNLRVVTQADGFAGAKGIVIMPQKKWSGCLYNAGCKLPHAGDRLMLQVRFRYMAEGHLETQYCKSMFALSFRDSTYGTNKVVRVILQRTGIEQGPGSLRIYWVSGGHGPSICVPESLVGIIGGNGTSDWLEMSIMLVRGISTDDWILETVVSNLVSDALVLSHRINDMKPNEPLRDNHKLVGSFDAADVADTKVSRCEVDTFELVLSRAQEASSAEGGQ